MLARDLMDLQEQLGHHFKDLALLELALTHPSLTNDPSNPIPDNQRLEFLGDSVLQLVLTELLFERFPDFGEGPLTKARAQLVNRGALAEQGRQVELGRHIRLSRGEELQGGRYRVSTLADAFEAVIGAIFLDSGFEAARRFLLRRFHPMVGELKALPHLHNPKGELQELLQAQSPDPITYCLASASGPDHAPLFECTVHYRGEEIGRGIGKSKKEAETRAALAALEELRQKQAGLSASGDSSQS